MILDANARAVVNGGAYQSPVTIQELNAYTLSGSWINALGKSGTMTVSFSMNSNNTVVANFPVSIRAESLSLWVLDESHHLWVKLPDSQINTSGSQVIATVSQLGVYALMGSAVGDAQNVYVFPTPWRPHGPNAGSGPGQTGTESDGMTFNNLPSECTIRIYTLAGGLVRDIHHSDLNGTLAQEKWDGNTVNGDHAASGVYLWRVFSANDAKNGKLMIIR